MGVAVPEEEVLVKWAQGGGLQGSFPDICANPKTKDHLLRELTATGKAGKLKVPLQLHNPRARAACSQRCCPGSKALPGAWSQWSRNTRGTFCLSKRWAMHCYGKRTARWVVQATCGRYL